MIATETLAALFVETADTLVDDFDLIEFLAVITTRAAQVSHADSAGLVLADPHGNLQYMAASRESARLMELFAIQNDEGPCFDCYRTGHAVSCAELSASVDRWPRFADKAVHFGFTGVHALPLRHRGTTIGALNLFTAGGPLLSGDDVTILQAVADVATIAILQERTIRAGEVLNSQLQAALNSRIVIEQAKGALARILSVTVDDAFTEMRVYARANHLKLSDVAREVLTEPGRHAALTHLGTPGPGPVRGSI